MKNLPTATVEVVDPIILGVKVREAEDHCCCCCCCCNDIPESVSRNINGNLDDRDGRYVTVALGIFSIVRITRPAQYVINATEYCIPDKVCVSTEDENPCAIFKNMAFPTQEFCPPDYFQQRLDDGGPKCGCGS